MRSAALVTPQQNGKPESKNLHPLKSFSASFIRNCSPSLNCLFWKTKPHIKRVLIIIYTTKRHLYVIQAFLYSHTNLNEVNLNATHLMGWRQSYRFSTERNQISERETVETWWERKQADEVCFLWLLLLKLTEATWSSKSWLVSW